MASIDPLIYSFNHSGSIECVSAAFLFAAGLVCLKEPLCFLAFGRSIISLGGGISKRCFAFSSDEVRKTGTMTHLPC